MQQLINTALQDFLTQHNLPTTYLEQAETYFQPLVETILRKKTHNHPFVVGIHGCQGSGKTTLAEYLKTILSECHHLNTIAISMDDFYLSKDERESIAESVHPLLKTRGVPGTHNLTLALHVIEQLLANKSIQIPVFDKSIDNVIPRENWVKVTEPLDVIILEGWCLGVAPQNADCLIEPINPLEREKDAEGIWRNYVNQQLNHYQPWFNTVDFLVMLKAPDFDCVYQWRLEQEQKLLASLNNTDNEVMNADQIHHFIQFFQRLTEHALVSLPEKVDLLYFLDRERRIVKLEVR